MTSMQVPAAAGSCELLNSFYEKGDQELLSGDVAAERTAGPPRPGHGDAARWPGNPLADRGGEDGWPKRTVLLKLVDRDQRGALLVVDEKKDVHASLLADEATIGGDGMEGGDSGELPDVEQRQCGEVGRRRRAEERPWCTIWGWRTLSSFLRTGRDYTRPVSYCGAALQNDFPNIFTDAINF